MRINITFIAVLVVFGLFGSPDEALAQQGGTAQGGRTWSGTVLDIRTGQPISSVEVKAGIRGRVDAFPGYLATTEADGKFSITWPEDSWRNWNAGAINHYLRIRALPETWRTVASTGYWQAVVIRSSPTEVTVYLVPRPVYVKGQLLSAADDTPLANVWVNLGAKRQSAEGYGLPRGVRTDANGFFAFPAATGFPSDDRGWPSPLYDIPANLTTQHSDETCEVQRCETGPYNDFAIGAGGSFYPIPQAHVVTSIDNSIHTYAVVRVPASGQPLPANAITSELRGLTPTPTTPPTPGQPPSEGISLTGEWDLNANNHRGKITITQQDGNQFSGRIYGEQLVNGIIDGNTVTFTRLWASGFRQDYTGTLDIGADGQARFTGNFTQQGAGSYNWTATKTGTATTRPTSAGFTVEAGKRNLSQGGSVTVPVSLNNVDGLANMNVNVHYDPAVVRPAQNAARGNLIPQALFEANVRDRGVIRLGFAQRDDIRGTGTLAQIPFEAVGRPGTRTPLRLEVTMASAAAGSRVTPAQLIHGEIMIVGADGRLPGDTSGEGNLTALDAMNALKMSVGNLPVDMVADMDRDGQVTARDATLILQEVVGR